MKMSFPIFFGILVVLAGVSILLKALFHIDLPLVRTAVALFFIFLGVRMIFGAWGSRATEVAATGAAVMTDARFAPTVPAERLKYDVIFGHGTIDLTGMPRPEKPIDLEINAIFGAVQLTVDPSWPMVIDGSSAFGEVRMPDHTRAAFGDAHYRSGGGAEPLLRARVNAVFGSAQVIDAGRAVPPGAPAARPSH